MASLKKRNGIFYLQYSLGGNIRRVSTGTDSLQLAKDKKRKLESSLLRENCGISKPATAASPATRISSTSA